MSTLTWIGKEKVINHYLDIPYEGIRSWLVNTILVETVSKTILLTKNETDEQTKYPFEHPYF